MVDRLARNGSGAWALGEVSVAEFLGAETAFGGGIMPRLPLLIQNLSMQASYLALGDKAEVGGAYGPIGAICSGVLPGWCYVVLLSVMALDRNHTTPAAATRARCSPGTHVRVLPRGVVRPAFGCQGRDRRRVLSSIPADDKRMSEEPNFTSLT